MSEERNALTQNEAAHLINAGSVAGNSDICFRKLVEEAGNSISPAQLTEFRKTLLKEPIGDVLDGHELAEEICAGRFWAARPLGDFVRKEWKP